MKSAKSLLAFVAIFGAATSAFATEPSTTATIVRIVGSTAFRQQTHDAIIAIYDAAPVAAYSGSNLSGCNQSFFYGQVSSAPVIIETSWSGSAGGVQVVAGGLTANFLADNLADSTINLATASSLSGSGSAAIATGGASLSAGTNSHVADVTMTDVFQSATPFRSPTLHDTTVGIVPFKWVASRGSNVVTLAADTTSGSPVLANISSTASLAVGMTVSSANLPATLVHIISVDSESQVTLSGNATGTATAAITIFVTPCPINNVSPQNAQALYGSGTAALSVFTGNSADQGALVYAFGRNPDSGTRITAFAESGVGVFSTVSQYKPVVSGSAMTGVALYASETVNGILFTAGNSGEASGSTLRGYMGLTTAALNGGNGAYALAYLSTGDAVTSLSLGGKELSYNGVFYSVSNVQQGLYTFWGYEHLDYQSGLASGKKTIANSIGTQIINTYSPVLLSSMKVSRSGDGGVVLQNF